MAEVTDIQKHKEEVKELFDSLKQKLLDIDLTQHQEIELYEIMKLISKAHSDYNKLLKDPNFKVKGFKKEKIEFQVNNLGGNIKQINKSS